MTVKEHEAQQHIEDRQRTLPHPHFYISGPTAAGVKSSGLARERAGSTRPTAAAGQLA